MTVCCIMKNAFQNKPFLRASRLLCVFFISHQCASVIAAITLLELKQRLTRARRLNIAGPYHITEGKSLSCSPFPCSLQLSALCCCRGNRQREESDAVGTIDGGSFGGFSPSPTERLHTSLLHTVRGITG